MTQESTDLIDEEVEDEDVESVENFFLQMGYGGCEEYTKLTTFHGMIRMFKSQTWTSLIFWCATVTTCLVFYMSFCGYVINSYAAKTSFQKISKSSAASSSVNYIACTSEWLTCKSVYIDPQPSYCHSYSDRDRDFCISFKVPSYSIRIRADITEMRLILGTEEDTIPIDSFHDHQLLLQINQIERLNISRAKCAKTFDDFQWFSGPSQPYSMKRCERIKPENQTCFPACSETILKRVHSIIPRTIKNGVTLKINLKKLQVNKIETRKVTIIDVLCFLGGASSLFMGCSCITLMETFVFLFKLIIRSALAGSSASTGLSEVGDEILDDNIEDEGFRATSHYRKFTLYDATMSTQDMLTKKQKDDALFAKPKGVPIRKRKLSSAKSSIRRKIDEPTRAPPLAVIGKTGKLKGISVEDERISQNIPPKPGQFDFNKNKLLSRQEAIEVTDADLENHLGKNEEKVEEEKKERLPRMTRADRQSSITSYSSRKSLGSTTSSYRMLVRRPSSNKIRSIYSRTLPMNDF